MLIHKEGKRVLIKWLIIFILVDITLFIYSSVDILNFIVFVLTASLYVTMINFYKKPKRIYAGQLLGWVIAPADGKIVAIEKVFEKDYLQQECIQISIFMSFFNAHSNWVPVTGKVVHLSHDMGRFHAAYLPKSSCDNERTNIIFETPDGHRILTRQIAGAIAKRIVTYVNESETYNIADPLGFIKLGSRVDLFLPLGSEILVKMNQQVRANKTFLARLPQKKTIKN